MSRKPSPAVLARLGPISPLSALLVGTTPRRQSHHIHARQCHSHHVHFWDLRECYKEVGAPRRPHYWEDGEEERGR